MKNPKKMLASRFVLAVALALPGPPALAQDRVPDLLDTVAFDGLEQDVAGLETALSGIRDTLSEMRAENLALRTMLSQVVASGEMRDAMVAKATADAEAAKTAADAAVAQVEDTTKRDALAKELAEARAQLAAFQKKIEDAGTATKEDEEAFREIVEEQRAALQARLDAQRKEIEEALQKCGTETRSAVQDALKTGTRKFDGDTAGRTADLLSQGVRNALKGCADDAEALLDDYDNIEDAKKEFTKQAMSMATALMAVNPALALALMAIVALLSMGDGDGDGDGEKGEKRENQNDRNEGTATGETTTPPRSAETDAPPSSGTTVTVETPKSDSIFANPPGGTCKTLKEGDVLTFVYTADRNKQFELVWKEIDWGAAGLAEPPTQADDSRISGLHCDFAKNELRFLVGSDCITVTPKPDRSAVASIGILGDGNACLSKDG